MSDEPAREPGVGTKQRIGDAVKRSRKVADEATHRGSQAIAASARRSSTLAGAAAAKGRIGARTAVSRGGEAAAVAVREGKRTAGLLVRSGKRLLDDLEVHEKAKKKAKEVLVDGGTEVLRNPVVQEVLVAGVEAVTPTGAALLKKRLPKRVTGSGTKRAPTKGRGASKGVSKELGTPAKKTPAKKTPAKKTTA